MEDWAEIRRLHRAEGIPIKQIARVLGVSRNTVRVALRTCRPGPGWPRSSSRPAGTASTAGPARRTCARTPCGSAWSGPAARPDYLVYPASALIPLPDSVPFDAAAVTMDAVAVPWRALVTRGALRAGETVLVIGAGGLGLNAIQIAVGLGARVAVVDPAQSHLDLAGKLGAELLMTSLDRALLDDLRPGGADLALESSGSAPGFRSAVEGIRPGGRAVVCGYWPGLDFAFDSSSVTMGERLALGSRRATRADVEQALAEVAAGRVGPTFAGRAGFESVNDLLGTLADGGALGRLIVEI